MVITSIEQCFDHGNIDMPGLWSLIKYECITCNMNQMRQENKRCKDCNFVFNSGTIRKDGIKESRVGCGAKFKKYGIKSGLTEHVGKYQILFFLYYPEYNFKFPEFPKVDMFGNERKDTWSWHLHHLNRIYYDDRKQNICLCINTEHVFIENSGIVSWRWKY